MIYALIDNLIAYALKRELIEKEDRIFHRNCLLDLFKIEEYKRSKKISKMDLEELLDRLLAYACKNGLCENNTIARDLFDTKIMGILTPKPSKIIHQFKQYYKVHPKKASDFFYKLNENSNYIRTYRIKKDIKWQDKNIYGNFDITINLAKPEKDPKAIARAKHEGINYPKCPLCKENEGYAGNYKHAARQNLRIIPLKLANEAWAFQYSPYAYYKEHCIVFKQRHSPMKICKKSFERLLDFLEFFPHYFIGCNADLPIVGGSILSHDHFQGGNYNFALFNAKIERKCKIRNFENIDFSILKWPLSVIRISSKDRMKLIQLADLILKKWKQYTDISANIIAKTKNIHHNSITAIARKDNCNFELNLVLRNNRTDKAHPFGIFHPQRHLHHIKKENIGLIEVMGLAILPPRLKNELQSLRHYIICKKNIKNNKKIKKHYQWVENFLPKYKCTEETKIEKIFQKELSRSFIEILESCAVFKHDEGGRQAFDKFIQVLNV